MVRNIIFYIIYVLIVAGLVTAIYLGFRSDKLTSDTPKTTTSKTAPQKAKTDAKAPAPKAESSGLSSTSNAGSVASNTATDTTTTPAPDANSSSTALANTGPGAVGTLFVISSASGSVGYWLYQRHKLTRQNT